MKQIVFVTGNPTKILHAYTALKEFGYEVVGKKLDIIEPREEETELIAREKALQAIKILNCPLIVEDSGIFIRALNGFPKTFIHFVEGTIGMAGIVKLMEGVADRYAEFRQTLSYIEPGMDEPELFSYVDGDFMVADRVWEGSEGANFDKILIPSGENKPICLFSREWQAVRDTQQNKGRIHYEQLAKWLISRE